jgi:hypothetical protein
MIEAPAYALPAVAADDGPSIHRWENEGGSYSMTDELDLEVDGCEKRDVTHGRARPHARSFRIPRMVPIASVS